ncbi:MAG TPA: dipeptide epimerase [Isosphaeraceae bacterium]|nr:dipeptide epimerase [Isosphaeraceae bacterium]
MMIAALKLFRVAVPLKKVVRHASFERSGSENLVVRVELAGGQVGYGEGVPRPYVTGETIESTFGVLAAHDWARRIGRPADFREVVQRLEALRLPETEADPRGRAGNAARCALELAILDAFGRRFGESAGRTIDLATIEGLQRYPAPRPVRYSGAITSESPLGEWRTALKIRLYGFHQVKVKVGTRGQDDARRLRALRWILGRRMDLRLDANEAWSAAELVERVEPLRRFGPTALEQPVPHAEVESLAAIRGRLGIPVMLDESLCGLPDAEAAVARRTADLFNVRLSKCGGILASLRIIALAQRSGLGVQLGCHPGETALLSAAGRHLASRVAGLRYVEGSYDRHILAANLTRQDLTFGYGGWARALDGPGLGVDVDPAALEAITVGSQEFRYD